MSADDTRELIYETRQDVAAVRQDVSWIKTTLNEIKKANEVQDKRIQALENQQHQWVGRDGAITAAISGAVAFIVALLTGGYLR